MKKYTTKSILPKNHMQINERLGIDTKLYIKNQMKQEIVKTLFEKDFLVSEELENGDIKYSFDLYCMTQKEYDELVQDIKEMRFALPVHIKKLLEIE